NAIHDAYFSEVVEAERKRKQARLTQIETSVTRMQGELEKKLPPAAKKDDQPAEALPGVGPSVASGQVIRLREKLDQAAVRQQRIAEFHKTQAQETSRRLQADEEKLDAELASLKVSQEKARTELKEYEAWLAKHLPEADAPKDFGKVDTQNRATIIEGLMSTA